MRNFLVGLIGSIAVSAAGLGAVSYWVPQRVTLAAAPAPASVPEAVPASAPEVAPDVVPKDVPQIAPQAPTAAPATNITSPQTPAPSAAQPKPIQSEPMLDPIQPAKTTPPAPSPAPPNIETAPPSPTDTQAAQPDPASPLAIAPAESAPRAIDLGIPLQAYAANFAGAAGKPLFAIVLRDTGAPDIDRAVLASLPFPVTFAVDPDSETALQAMAIYRAAGKEVVIFANSLPTGATAQDIAQSFSVYSAVLPETVAVMSPPQGGFQDDLALSALVLPEIAAGGRGVVLVQKGLNSAGQIAQREGIPFASVTRIIDGGGESLPVLRRYLDRAVFAAAQDGAAIVMGSTLPDTITALTEWAVEGRASEVTLAPISAMMQQ